MLCKVCQDAFLEQSQTNEESTDRSGPVTQTKAFPSPFYKASHHNLPRLKQSALDGCSLCNLLWTTAPLEIHNILDEYLQNERSAHWLPCYLTIDRSIFRDVQTARKLMLEYKYQTIVVDEESYIPPFKRHFRLLQREDEVSNLSPSTVGSNTWSEESWVTIRTWISNCFSKHSKCTPISESHQRKLPRRLIEVGQGEKVRLRTVERANNHEIEYLALSHCWGSAPQLTLTTLSEGALHEGIPISSLCKTFQDAILVARRFWDEFGIRYLWIDSLCILQDSIGDWRHESAIMGDVYQNAFCTLAATAAEDGSQGLFSERASHRVLPCSISVVLKNGAKRVYHCVDTEDWTRNVRNAPLNTRSWVLQERLLSPRVLHFAADKLYWECSELEACESFRTGLPDGLGEQFKQLLPFSGESKSHQQGPGTRGPYIIWDQVMKTYSAGDLSRNTDRLIALSGIARKLHRFVIPHDTYVAGLWNSDLPFQLLWDVETCQSPIISPDDYIAPSWSWASRTRTVPCEQETWVSASKLVNIISVVVSPVGNDRMGQVNGGYIRLSGVLARGSLSRIHQPGSSTAGIALKIANKTVFSAICRLDDGLSSSTHLPHVMYCLPILQGMRNRVPRYKGLLLVPSGREREFRRYGTFTTDSSNNDFLVSCSPYTFETGDLDSNGCYEITIV